MSTERVGASLDARYPEPAIDLATLVEGLAESIAARPDVAPRQAITDRPLLIWDEGAQCLAVNTRAVLARFWRTPQFRKLQSGFIRDAQVPKSRARAYLGGRIVPGTERQLRVAIDRLARAIDREIDGRVTTGVELSWLAGSRTGDTLGRLARRLGFSLEEMLAARTHVERVTFAPVGPTRQARRSEVARVMAAIEELDGDRARRIEDFLGAVRSFLRTRDFTEREIDAALHHHEAQASEPGSQLARFFDFLEDEALARVRVEVGCRMMETLADEAADRRDADSTGGLALFEIYVRRALGLWNVLRSADSLPVSVNLSGTYGAAADFVLQTVAVTAGFATCLPVWPSWEAQLFEDEQSGAESAVRRELSYRFRVNGREPFAGKPAYAARLDRLEQNLLGREVPQRVRRSLAELVFLGTVIPRNTNDETGPEAVLTAARSHIRDLEQAGNEGVAALIAQLREREPVMDRVSRALIALLRVEGAAVTRSAQGRAWDYYVNVARSLLDPQRIAAAVERPLVADPDPNQEQIDFFRAVQITPDRAMPGSLFSMRVRVRLSERSLQLAADPLDLSLTRRLPERLLQVVWRPFQVAKSADTAAWVPAAAGDAEWLLPNRVEVQYDPLTLGTQRTDERFIVGAAVSRTALAVLVYTSLLRLFERFWPDVAASPAVSMLRLQMAGREAVASSGDAGIFAVAQAVEIALGRDADLRMQGIVLDAEAVTSRHKRRGVCGALLAGFPLQMAPIDGERPSIGVVSFAARPCNDHPDLPNATGRRLFLTRTYLATPIEQPTSGYEVRSVRGRTEVAAAETNLPVTVREEIRHLHDVHGCRHILLLWHRFAQRRIGRQASGDRRRHQAAFLRSLAEDFPELVVYPLVRDVFPATRIRGREWDQDAFEVLQPDEHLQGAPDAARQLRSTYTPLYSLATLHVVGETSTLTKPQSGFCTYFVAGDDGTAPIETTARLGSNLLLSSSPVRASLLAALRSIHYLEAERAVTGSEAGRPVLDPYDWMAPDTGGKVGEVVVFERSRRRPGSVVLSLTAVLDAVSRMLHAPAARDLRGDRELATFRGQGDGAG